MNSPPTPLESEAAVSEAREARQQLVTRLRLFWAARKLVLGAFVIGALTSLGLALLIPSRYEATTQLMPPDGQSSSGMAMLSALAGRAGGLGGVAGDKSLESAYESVLSGRDRFSLSARASVPMEREVLLER